MKYQILIIETNAAIGQHWETALVRTGAAFGLQFIVRSVRSIAAGQLVTGRQSYDLVIASLDGESLGFIRRVRHRWPLLRVLLLHAPDVDAAMLREAELVGCSVAPRPASNAELVVAVGAALGLPLREEAARSAEARPAATVADVQLLLDVLRRQASAQLVVYTDAVGNTIAYRGNADHLELSAVTSLMVGSSANLLELGRTLNDPATVHLIVFESVHFDIYAANVGDQGLLVLIFAKEFVEPRLGYVWLLLKRSVQQLKAMRLIEGNAGEVIAAELSASLNNDFQRFFGDDLLEG